MTELLQENVDLQPRNSFGVPARARWFATIRSVADLDRLAQDGRIETVPTLVLGGGSNILFLNDYPGLVLNVAIPGVQELPGDGHAQFIRVGAGEPWPALVARLVAEGRPGLENLALIPGRAGAAPIQNIGAYGLELAERLHSVQVWDAHRGVVSDYSVEDCGLGYRDSVFKRMAANTCQVITSITLRLPRAWQAVRGYQELDRELQARGVEAPGPQDIFEAVCALRRRKLPDPETLGNAGSFFKNPIVSRDQHARLLEAFPSIVSYPLAGGRFKLAAGWLIDACGLKGHGRGRAGVYERQALVLINRGGASGAEIWALAQDVRARVLERFGVALEPEVRVIT
jgi:UDP-N-acetylmuramate dehydrogenase